MLATALTILPVFLIIFSGYLAGRTGLVPPASAHVINRFVVWIPMPLLVFHIVAKTDWHHYWNWGFIAASILPCAIVFVLGALAGRAFGEDSVGCAIEGLDAAYCNAGYLGMPMLILLFGPQAAPYAVVVFAVTLSGIFALSLIFIELTRGQEHGLERAMAKAARQTFTNPVIVAPVLGALWWRSGIAMPAVMDQFLTLVGNAASPAALIGIGLLLAQAPLASSLVNPLVYVSTSLKLIVHPALTAFAALVIFHVPRDLALIVTLIAAMPTGTGPFMMSGLYGRNGGATSGTILLSTIISAATITALLTLFEA